VGKDSGGFGIEMTKYCLLFLIAFSAQPSWAMDITVDGSTVSMSGRVVGSECDQLHKIIDNNVIKNVVLGDSPGGDAEAGYCVGALIRTNGLSTSIIGSCASSCSRMWLGGVTRTLTGSDSRVGLHGNYGSTGELLSTAPTRLRAWIPLYAPTVDKDLMEKWINLPINTSVMYFYNDRAELCDGNECSAVPHWSARTAGLTTPQS